MSTAAWKFQESPIPGQQFGGKGVEYAEFVMEVVKPFIDETYRTKADRQHTAMIGSSLGGNITQFIGLEYQDRIGCLGVFICQLASPEAFNRYIERKKLTPEQRIFIYVRNRRSRRYGQDPNGWQYQSKPISTRRFVIIMI